MDNKKQNTGKLFEAEFKASVPEIVFLERYKDDTAGFYGVCNPADFRLYLYPYTFLLELKTHKGKSLPKDKIRERQLKAMYAAAGHKGVYAGYLINFRDLEETYYVPVSSIVKVYYSEDRKSIPVEFCRENGIKIEQEKKRVRYRYNIAKWISLYYGNGHF